MLVSWPVLSSIPGSGAVQLHAESDRYRLDGELRDPGDAVNPQSAAMGRARIAMGLADWSLRTVSVWRIDGWRSGAMMASSDESI
ncbi:exported hypothetical protein [Nitrospira lenta]|uniref:Uncharacterized protein n=1 Tax=Nitrospira lenta TaxID=1436998 RepID=A0A330LAP6_9BACT|nr:exported hypothetical protein [Nitrospira lenta]